MTIKQSDIFENEQKVIDQFAYNIFTHVDLSVPGAKFDDDKPDLDLVLGDFSRALIEVGKVGTFGAKKYSEHGWLSVPNGYRRYQSALLRHHFSKEEDGPYDLESKLLHDAHRAWNALAALELYLRDKK